MSVIINKRSFESVLCLGHVHANFAVVDTPATRAALTQSPSALTIHGAVRGLVPAEQPIRDDREKRQLSGPVDLLINRPVDRAVDGASATRHKYSRGVVCLVNPGEGFAVDFPCLGRTPSIPRSSFRRLT